KPRAASHLRRLAGWRAVRGLSARDGLCCPGLEECMTVSVDSVLSLLTASEPQSVTRLIDWLKIPSISTDPAYKPQVRQAAEWAAAQLRELGFVVRVLDTGAPAGSGRPVVLGRLAPTASYA